MPATPTYPAPTSIEIRAQLDARAQSIEDRIASLRHELTTVTDVTVAGRPLPDFIRERPLVYAGLSLAGGLALGLLAGLRARARRPPMDERTEVLRLYVAYLLDEAAERVARGKEPEQAIAKTLRRRPPLIYYAPLEPPVRSTIRETVDVGIKTALGFGIKMGLDQLARRFTHQDELFSAVEAAKENPTL